MKRTVPHRKEIYRPPSIVLTLALLFILIASGATFQGYKQFQNIMAQAIDADRIMARMTAMVMEESQQAIQETLESYASRPLFVDSIVHRDTEGIRRHLVDLKRNNDEIEQLFVADAEGVPLVLYPPLPGSIGDKLSDRSWFRGVSAAWQSYISNVSHLIDDGSPLAITVAVPVFDDNGQVTGTLANAIRLTTINKLFSSLHTERSETVYLVDQTGNIIYNSRNSTIEHITAYPFYREAQKALAAKQTKLETAEPNGDKKILAIAPTDIGWSVVVERSPRDTLRLEYKRLVRTAVIAILLFLFIAAYIIYQNSLHEKAVALLLLQRQLGQSQRQYKSLIENIPDILYRFSNRHTDDYYSPRVEAVLGYTAEQLIAHPTLWHDSIHPEHLAEVDQAIEDAKSGREIAVEYRIYDRHGRCHWLADHMGSVPDENGEPVITGLASDITERKTLAEQRQAALNLLQNIADRVPGVVFQCRLNCDGSLSFPFLSQGLRATYQLSPEEAQEDSAQIFAMHHPDDREGIIASLHKSAEEVTPWAHEYRLKLADGSERWLSGSAMPQMERDGSTLWHGVIMDITERRQAEEQLRIINEELERRVEQRTRELQETQAQYLHVEKLSAIGKLSASIAHEFNSPLQAVMTVLKILKMNEKLDAEEGKLLQAAIEESKRMKNLIWSLRDFNRPSSGRKTLLDVHATITSLLLLYKTDFSRKKILTKLNFADRLPQILAIPDQIKQVFINLLNNAADATLESGGLITISTWREKDKVAVAIEDTGIGIPPEKIDLIFQPFYTTKPEIKGTGLGLSICHGIIQNHNGEIRVESEPGKGSTFTVLLPINEG